MLRAIHRAKNPDSADTPVFLRGFSWIVNPFEDSGVVVAIEIQTGAAVAGPFRIDKRQLEDMIARAIARQTTSPRRDSLTEPHYIGSLSLPFNTAQRGHLFARHASAQYPL